MTCPTAGTTGTPDVLWIVDGGYSSDVQGSPGHAPPALAGLVGNSVAAVTLVSGEHRKTLNVVNGAFFAELAFPSSDSRMTFEVTYMDGSTKTEILSNPEN